MDNGNSSEPRPMNEIERESVRLASNIDWLKISMEDLMKKLQPVMNPNAAIKMPGVDGGEKSQAPQTPLGLSFRGHADRVQEIINSLSAISQSLEI